MHWTCSTGRRARPTWGWRDRGWDRPRPSPSSLVEWTVSFVDLCSFSLCSLSVGVLLVCDAAWRIEQSSIKCKKTKCVNIYNLRDWELADVKYWSTYKRAKRHWPESLTHDLDIWLLTWIFESWPGYLTPDLDLWLFTWIFDPWPGYLTPVLDLWLLTWIFDSWPESLTPYLDIWLLTWIFDSWPVSLTPDLVLWFSFLSQEAFTTWMRTGQSWNHSPRTAPSGSYCTTRRKTFSSPWRPTWCWHSTVCHQMATPASYSRSVGSYTNCHGRTG